MRFHCIYIWKGVIVKPVLNGHFDERTPSDNGKLS